MTAQPVPVQWGLPDRKAKGTHPKCFNIASKIQKSTIEQPLTCRVHPVVVVKVLDAWGRRPESEHRTIGTLLGWISEGSIVDITDCFAVNHKDTPDEGVKTDQDYHKNMVSLRQKASPREVVVGWFSTGSRDDINGNTAVIHEFYCRKESQFTATPVLPGPIHLLVDTSLDTSEGRLLPLQAFVAVSTTAAAGNLQQFHEIPLRVQTSATERTGISQLVHARRATREAQHANAAPKDIATLDGFEGGLKELLGLFKRIQGYVKAVLAGQEEAHLTVGRGLTLSLCSEPVIDVEAVENLCSSSLQDALMVVFLSNLTKAQISIAEKIASQFGALQNE